MPDPTRRERILEAIALLTEHNRWRRGDEKEMHNPHKIGVAIDTLAEVKEELERDVNASPTMADDDLTTAYMAGSASRLDEIRKLKEELNKMRLQRNDLANALWCAEAQWGREYLWWKLKLSEQLTEELKKELAIGKMKTRLLC
jgi:hypothetical protein